MSSLHLIYIPYYRIYRSSLYMSKPLKSIFHRLLHYRRYLDSLSLFITPSISLSFSITDPRYLNRMSCGIIWSPTVISRLKNFFFCWTYIPYTPSYLYLSENYVFLKLISKLPTSFKSSIDSLKKTISSVKKNIHLEASS